MKGKQNKRSKSRVRSEWNLETKSCWFIWVDLERVFEPASIPQMAINIPTLKTSCLKTMKIEQVQIRMLASTNWKPYFNFMVAIYLQLNFNFNSIWLKIYLILFFYTSWRKMSFLFSLRLIYGAKQCSHCILRIWKRKQNFNFFLCLTGLKKSAFNMSC